MINTRNLDLDLDLDSSFNVEFCPTSTSTAALTSIAPLTLSSA
jgi:hypothetical protein